jgi:hypothetical protein
MPGPHQGVGNRGGAVDVPIPDVILALIVAAIVIGEVADEILREREVELVA